jgi:hypothetical protein
MDIIYEHRNPHIDSIFLSRRNPPPRCFLEGYWIASASASPDSDDEDDSDEEIA